MSAPRRRQLTATNAARRAEVVRLRALGHTWPEIAEQVGVSVRRAGQIFDDALADIPAPDVAAYRRQLLAEGDEAVQHLRRIVADPTESARTRVEALAVWFRWSERLGRLLGADAAVRSSVEVITIDVVDAEIKRLTAEIEQDAALDAARDSARRALPPGERDTDDEGDQA